MDEAAWLSSAPDAAPLALPAPEVAAEDALVPHVPHPVAAVARSRYEAPVLPAVLPRADAQQFRPLLGAAPGAAAGAAPGGPDGARTQPPRGACCAARRAAPAALRARNRRRRSGQRCLERAAAR